MAKNQPYLQVLNELIDEHIGGDTVYVESDKGDERIHFKIKNDKGVKGYLGLDGTIFTKDGYFILHNWNKKEYKFNSLDTFRDYAFQIIETVCKPYLIELYKSNSISKLPPKMEEPKINIDLSKITPKWITKVFKEVTEDVSNGDYIEDVKIETNFTLPSGASSGKEAFEDGIKITFKVWWNRWGDFMTDKHRYYIKVNNKGLVSCNLPEAIEGGDIESGLEEMINYYIKI